MIVARHSAKIPAGRQIAQSAAAHANDMAVCPDGKEDPCGRLIRTGIFLNRSHGLFLINADFKIRLFTTAVAASTSK